MNISQLRVLVVDDNTAARESVRAILRAVGVSKILVAPNGETAWRQVQQAASLGNPFDLIISDINMPVGSGMELLREVRSHPKTMDTRFVVMTGYDQSGLVDKAALAGANGYLTKPIAPQSLEEKVRELFKDSVKMAA